MLPTKKMLELKTSVMTLLQLNAMGAAELPDPDLLSMFIGYLEDPSKEVAQKLEPWQDELLKDPRIANGADDIRKRYLKMCNRRLLDGARKSILAVREYDAKVEFNRCGYPPKDNEPEGIVTCYEEIDQDKLRKYRWLALDSAERLEEPVWRALIEHDRHNGKFGVYDVNHKTTLYWFYNDCVRKFGLEPELSISPTLNRYLEHNLFGLVVFMTYGKWTGAELMVDEKGETYAASISTGRIS